MKNNIPKYEKITKAMSHIYKAKKELLESEKPKGNLLMQEEKEANRILYLLGTMQPEKDINPVIEEIKSISERDVIIIYTLNNLKYGIKLSKIEDELTIKLYKAAEKIENGSCTIPEALLISFQYAPQVAVG